MAGLLTVTISRNDQVLYAFREAVVDFRMSITDRSSNTVQTDIPMTSVTVKILTNAILGTYQNLVGGETVRIISDEALEAGLAPLVYVLQTASHHVSQGELELTCTREELNKKVSFKGQTSVQRGIADMLLEKVSIEGMGAIKTDYPVQLDVDYASDYAVALAWSRPWRPADAAKLEKFRPDSIALLPYIGQLTKDASKSVEIFNTGSMNNVKLTAPVYFADVSCIITLELESAQPPVSDVAVAKSGYSDMSYTYTSDGVMAQVPNQQTHEIALTPVYPKVYSCPELGISLTVTRGTFRWSDGLVVEMPLPRTIVPVAWGYTSEQWRAMTRLITLHGVEYAPKIITQEEVIFWSDSLTVVCDRRTMQVKYEIPQGVVETDFSFECHELKGSPKAVAYVVLASTKTNNDSPITVSVTKKDNGDWRLTYQNFPNDKYLELQAWTLTKVSDRDSTLAVTALYKSEENIYYEHTWLRPGGDVDRSYEWFNSQPFPGHKVIKVLDIQRRFVQPPVDEKWLCFGQQMEPAREGTFLCEVNPSAQTYSVSFFAQDNATRASFLGIFNHDDPNLRSILPQTDMFVSIDSGNSQAFFYPNSSSQNHIVHDLSQVDENVDDWLVSKITLIGKKSSSATVAIRMFSNDDPFSLKSKKDELYSVKISDREENILKVPGLLNTIKVVKDTVDEDLGRLRLTIQKFGYSPGIGADKTSPVRELTTDLLPVMATGAYMKVYPEGKYSEGDCYVIKITSYKLSYNGVTTATVEGVVVGTELTPEENDLEYIVTDVPSYVMNADEELFVQYSIAGTSYTTVALKDGVNDSSIRFIVEGQTPIDRFVIFSCFKGTVVPSEVELGYVPGKIISASDVVNCSPAIREYESPQFN